MAILNGNTFSDYRINPLTNVEVPESVTGEIQTVIELSPANVGFYGFELNECPQDNGIASVTRNSDSQVFIRSTSAPSTNEYFIDYANQSPVVIFNATENGEAFTVAYNAIGTPMSVKRTLALASYNRDVACKIQAANSIDITPVSDILLLNNLAQIRNLTLTSNRAIFSNIPNTFGILEIFGDLQIDAGVTLILGRVLLIVHGNITGSGTISGVSGANGGNSVIGGGGGGGGIFLNIFCFGDIHNTITLSPGKGGSGGSGGGTATNGDDAFVDFGGTGGVVWFGVGGGGGGIGNGGDGGASGGIGAGGGGGGTGGATDFLWIGAGGNGGTGAFGIGQGGQTGYLQLFSRYSSAPCTVDVSAVSGGTAGNANYYNLANIDYARLVLHRDFSYFTKGDNAIDNAIQNGTVVSNQSWYQNGNVLTNFGYVTCNFSNAGSNNTITFAKPFSLSAFKNIQITLENNGVGDPYHIINSITDNSFNFVGYASIITTTIVHYTVTGIVS